MKELVWYKIMSDFDKKRIISDREQILKIRHNQYGKGISIELSNEYGDKPMIIKSLKISFKEDFKKSYSLLVNNSRNFVIPEYQVMRSDYLNIDICDDVLYIKLLLEPGQAISTLGSSKDRYLVDDLSNDDNFYYYGIKRIFIGINKALDQICFFGDSLTNQGYFTNQVVKRIAQNHKEWSSFNCGISGNRLLYDSHSMSLWASSFGNAGVNRLERDVFHNQKPKILLFFQGINDLYQAGNESPIEEMPTVEELRKAILKVLEICNKYACIFVPCTITPFQGIKNYGKNWDWKRESIRRGINEFIRSLPNCIDLDRYLADVNNHSLLNIKYDCGDGLHFNKLGGIYIGDYIYEHIKHLL